MSKLKIGIMGSSLDELGTIEKARIIGRAIAEKNCILVTGASKGLPYEAVKSAKEHAVRSCDALVFISGGAGTLNEFTIAYDEGKVCGVLLDSGGISGIMKELEEKYLSGRKKSGKVIYHSDPVKLVEAVISELA